MAGTRALREFDGFQDADRLIDALLELDRLVDRALGFTLPLPLPLSAAAAAAAGALPAAHHTRPVAGGQCRDQAAQRNAGQPPPDLGA